MVPQGRALPLSPSKLPLNEQAVPLRFACVLLSRCRRHCVYCFCCCCFCCLLLLLLLWWTQWCNTLFACVSGTVPVSQQAL